MTAIYASVWSHKSDLIVEVLNVVKNEVVKKAVYDKLVAKVHNIDTNRFVLKTKCDADKTELEKKIPNTSRVVKKSDYNAKISELENKIPNISGLVTTSALTAVENKISIMLVVWLKRQTVTQKLVNLKRNLLIISMTNILLL